VIDWLPENAPFHCEKYPLGRPFDGSKLGRIQTANWKTALAFNRSSSLELGSDFWGDDFSTLV
jgi:hypothetical protein